MLPGMKKKPGDQNFTPPNTAELRAAFEGTFIHLLDVGERTERQPDRDFKDMANRVATELIDWKIGGDSGATFVSILKNFKGRAPGRVTATASLLLLGGLVQRLTVEVQRLTAENTKMNKELDLRRSLETATPFGRYFLRGLLELETQPQRQKTVRRTPKRRKSPGEQKRDRFQAGPGLIAEQFGGEPSILGGSPFLGDFLPLTEAGGPCLDAIWKNGKVKMGVGDCNLMELFGKERHKFKGLTIDMETDGRERFYGYRSVVKIADSLLRDVRQTHAWLPEPAIRATVLGRIKQRMETVEVLPEIKAAFDRLLAKYLK